MHICELSKNIPTPSLNMVSKKLVLIAIQWTKNMGPDSGVSRNFVWVGVQQIQLKTNGRENADVGAVAP
jgi:hypothetical protein